MAANAQSLVTLFLKPVEQQPHEPALAVYRGDSFVWLTWQQLAADVWRCAAALESLGIHPGERVVQVSENRYEWIVIDLAVHMLQGVHVAVHSTLTGQQIAEQIADCEPRRIIVSTAEQAAKLEGKLPTQLPVVSHEQISKFAADADLERGEALAQQAAAALTSQSLATILYTSGTTGEPKGVMLSHGNLTSNAMACADAFESDDCARRLCWLPLSHIYARTSDMYTWIAKGSQMALARSRDTIIADCHLTQPTFINGVPYFYDKLVRHLRDSGQLDQPGAIQALLGGNVRSCCAGGATLSDETARAIERQGVLLVQGYGLTESSPVITTCTRAQHRLGTVGPPLPGVEVQIADDGEVLTRGPHVMLGYWKQPQATADVIRDGWLHTGDLGVLEDGYLRITGRKKEIIVLASGKNIAPVLIERLLCDDPLIAQAMVIGDSRNYLTALIVPEPAKLQSEIANMNVEHWDANASLTHSIVLALFRNRIDARLAQLSPQEQIGKFALIGRAFSIEHEELTPTLKLRRKQICEHFAAEIADLYTSPRC